MLKLCFKFFLNIIFTFSFFNLIFFLQFFTFLFLEPCLNVKLENVIKRNYKNARYSKHAGHSEWVRLGKLIDYLLSIRVMQFNDLLALDKVTFNCHDHKKAMAATSVFECMT